jgi:hypothetical protein
MNSSQPDKIFIEYLALRLCPVVSLKHAVLHLNLAMDYIHILGSQS